MKNQFSFCKQMCPNILLGVVLPLWGPFIGIEIFWAWKFEISPLKKKDKRRIMRRSFFYFFYRGLKVYYNYQKVIDPK